jgi:uncharacterized membrane-anchored protein YhcB (DUF1043 family)
MKLKAGIALIVVITLIIGIVIGALANRAIVRHRLNQTFRRVNPGYLSGFIQEVVDPDSEQARKIQSVLNEHTRQMQNLRSEYQNEMREHFQSLWNDLEPLLTPVQKRRLRRRPFGPREFFQDLRPPVPPAAHERILQEEINWLKQRLSLSPVQARRIRDILRAAERRAGPPPPPYAPEPPNRRRQIIIENLIKNILTAQQRSTFEAIKKEWWDFRHELRME